MKIKVSEEMVDEALHQLVDTVGKAAAIRGERYFQEEMRKPVKSLAMQDAEGNGHKTGFAQEREAYASQRYQKHLAAVRDAIIADEEMRMRRAGWEKLIDLWRTQAANERQWKV